MFNKMELADKKRREYKKLYSQRFLLEFEAQRSDPGRVTPLRRYRKYLTLKLHLSAFPEKVWYAYALRIP